jgi:hypothetical protein
MPAKRLSMRRIRELLRLKAAGGMSDRALALRLGVARSTINEGSYRVSGWWPAA